MLNLENIKQEKKLELVFNENNELTELGQYIVCSHAAKEFARQIKLDPTEKYYYKSTKSKLIVPENIEKEIKEMFRENLEAYQQALNHWKANNQEYFYEQKRVRNIAEFLSGFKFRPNGLNLEAMVQGYKRAKSLEDHFKTVESIRTEKATVILREHSELYKEVQSNLKREFEIDKYNEQLELAKVEVLVPSYRLALSRQPYSNDLPYEELKLQLMDHMSNLKFEEKE